MLYGNKYTTYIAYDDVVAALSLILLIMLPIMHAISMAATRCGVDSRLKCTFLITSNIIIKIVNVTTSSSIIRTSPPL